MVTQNRCSGAAARGVSLISAALLGVLGVGQGGYAAVVAQNGLQDVTLQCRLHAGPWSTCTMRIERIGEHWWLDINGEVLEFRHDGRGLITVKSSSGRVQQVQGHWDQASSALCWDGICTLGAVPLD